MVPDEKHIFTILQLKDYAHIMRKTDDMSVWVLSSLSDAIRSDHKLSVELNYTEQTYRVINKNKQ